MPHTACAQPTISQIYAAFSSASHAVFQQAMANSRGGVVRVEDLLAALIARDAEIGCHVLPGGWRPPTVGRAADRDHLTPMANEPALRELLRTGLLIAQAQPDREATEITPAVLWAAMVLSRRICCGLGHEELFRRLELRCPSWLSTPVCLAPPRATPQPAMSQPAASQPAPTVRRIEQLFDERALVDVILERWLAVQGWPVGVERDAELARIHELTKLLESRPIDRSSDGR